MQSMGRALHVMELWMSLLADATGCVLVQM